MSAIQLPLSRAIVDEAEVESAVRALRALQIGGNGPVGQQLSKRLSEMLDGASVALTTSCSDALELAVMALHLGPGEEVIMPSFGFPSIANAVMRQRAVPVFADITPDILNLDPAYCAALITPRTRGIITVHYAGHSSDMKALTSLCSSKGIWLVEDAAQGIGASCDGKPLGTIGTAGSFSFHATKNLTCGEGGAFITHDEELFRKAEIILEKGTNRSSFLRGEINKYTWHEIGSSFVLSDLLAALMLTQLDKLSAITEERRKLWARYQELLAPVARELPLTLPAERPGVLHNGHIYPVRVPAQHRTRIMTALRRDGISVASHFEPLHLSPCAQSLLYRNASAPKLPVTEKIAPELMRLPLYPGLLPKEQDFVVSRVKEALRTEI